VILLIDNYDSFTYNLAHLFAELGAEVCVRRNDEVDADEAELLAPSHLLVSPGPGRPAESGATLEIVRRLAPLTPHCFQKSCTPKSVMTPMIGAATDSTAPGCLSPCPVTTQTTRSVALMRPSRR